jgi:hypothetical protein
MNFILTGGLASLYYFTKEKCPLGVRKINDLDVIVTDHQGVLKTVSNIFLTNLLE